MTVSDIHPELQSRARILPMAPIRARLLPFFRWGSNLQKRLPAPRVEVLTTTEGIDIRLHRPTRPTGTGAAMLWIHGGGYVIGTAAQDDRMCRRFADELGITVAAVEYGLAPRHRYPEPLEHCYSALTWLTTLPAVDPRRIVIAGSSAGGGLAAQLALLVRDRAELTPVAQHLVYPMLDDRTVGPDHPGFRLWNGRSNRLGWDAYLGTADRDRAVPARRDDLAGLPPTWIGVGTMDLFHREDVAYADRLTAAGVPCQLDVVPGAYHGFDQVHARSAVSRQFFATQCAWLRSLPEYLTP